MLLAVFALLAAGILLGLYYKAPALLAATALVVIGALAWNMFGRENAPSGWMIVVLALVLQAGYLAGLWLALAIRRSAHQRSPDGFGRGHASSGCPIEPHDRKDGACQNDQIAPQ